MTRCLLPVLAALCSLLGYGACLECIVCSESSLDEFGECASQFRYDCSSYAANFARSERIFCRTTRKREANNTYTIAKECIAESDHNKVFPSKGYPVEDECDLIEIKGAEVAYCLCRYDKCNQKPIAEQFMGFEEKHPELFGEMDNEEDMSEELGKEEDKELLEQQQQPHHRPDVSLPLSKATAVKPGGIAFGTPQLAPIQPINDPRNPLIENSLRRAQPSFEIQKSTDDEKRPVLPSRGLDSLSIRKLNAEGKQAQKEIDTLSPWSSARAVANPAPAVVPSQSSGEDTEEMEGGEEKSERRGTKGTLRCMQCGEGGLSDMVNECLLQESVTCKGNSLCFTRYIAVGDSKNAIEKMCMSKEALAAEFAGTLDASAPETQCTSLSGGRVRVCVCGDDDNCNQPSIDEQMASSSRSVGSRVKAASAGPLQQPVVPIELNEQLASANTVAKGPSPDLFLPPDSHPIIPVGAKGTTPATATTPSPKIKTGVRCLHCSSGDLSDPTADCPSSAPIDCLALKGETVYCLTRQTQLANGLFSMEKNCMTAVEFTDDFPDETAAPGCGTAFDGLVNYCLCRGNECNAESLLTQAQTNVESVVKTPSTTTSRPFLKAFDAKQPPPHIAMEEEEGPNEETSKEISDMNTNLIVPEEDPEEQAKQEKIQREQRWKEDSERMLKENSVGGLPISSTLLSLIIIALLR